MNEILSLQSILGIDIPLEFSAQQIKQIRTLLPMENIARVLIYPNGVRRCQIVYRRVIDQGSSGTITQINRLDLSGVTLHSGVVCKSPKEDETYDLLEEALLQAAASHTLERAGLRGAIPPVYDIYKYGPQTRFTMDYVAGRSALDTIFTALNPDETLLHCLAQTCLLLSVLEDRLRLDHRDLKLSNLWIRPGEITYTVSIHGHTWICVSPFQVVLLDFGFACLGDSKGRAAVNLGDGAFPDLDPCPKSGRDMFQFLYSLWTVAPLRERLSPALRTQIEMWLTLEGMSGSRVAEAHGLPMSYILVADPKFKAPILHPYNLLQTMAQRWSHIVGYV